MQQHSIESYAFILEQVQHRMKPATIEQGWQLQQTRKVDRIQQSYGRLISAVLDRALYEVRLDVAEIANSECECGHDDCAHIVAVIFELCAQEGYAILPLKERLLNTQQADHSVVEASGADLRADQPAAWMNVLEHYWASTVQEPITRHFTAFDESLKRILLPAAKQWPKLRQGLFGIQACLFFLHKLEQHVHGDSYAFMRGAYWNFSSYADQYANLLIEHHQAHNWRVAHDKDMEQQLNLLSEYLHKLTLHGHSKSLVDWLFLYRLLWAGCLHNETRIIAEQQRLQKKADGNRLSVVMHTQIVLAQAHFDILYGDDVQAQSRMEAMGQMLPIELYMDYLNTFLSSKNRDRLIQWLNWCRPYVMRGSEWGQDTLLTLWHSAKIELGIKQEFVQAMKELLPISYRDYSDYLLERKQFREWVDLQLHVRMTPFELDAVELRRVEQADIHLLLPLYHQAIEQLVDARKRESYAAAVHCMLVLQQLYKRLNKEQLWQQVVDGWTQRYKRLRALKEEMAKGQIA